MFHINSGLSFKSIGGARSPVALPRFLPRRHANSEYIKTDETGLPRRRLVKVSLKYIVLFHEN